MGLIDLILGDSSGQRALKAAPGPSPWFVLRDGPTLRSRAGRLSWHPAPGGDTAAGKVVLQDSAGEVLLVLDFYCYVLALPDARCLIWYVRPLETTSGSVSSSEVVLSILALDKLRPLTDLDRAFASLTPGRGFAHEDGLIAQHRFGTELPHGRHEVQLPGEFDSIDELLLLVHSTAGGVIGNSFDRMHLTLWELRPSARTLEIVPQDWFNEGAFDFGYEWVAKVTRDPSSGRVIGEGVRLGFFELDSSRTRTARRWR